MDELTVAKLEVRYGDLVGVADVSIKVPQGSVVALLGSNGAGKTTTLNAIAGLVRPSRGVIEWRGASIFGEPAYAIVASGLALSPEGWRLFVSQTVEQNLRLGATALADKTKRSAGLDRVYAIFPRLAQADDPARTDADACVLQEPDGLQAIVEGVSGTLLRKVPP